MSEAAVGAQGAITQPPRPRPGLYTLHTDGGIGASPGVPGGEAAIGAVLKNSDNLLVEAISRSIGRVDDHHRRVRGACRGADDGEAPRRGQDPRVHRL
jgi:hypothetical protein